MTYRSLACGGRVGSSAWACHVQSRMCLRPWEMAFQQRESMCSGDGGAPGGALDQSHRILHGARWSVWLYPYRLRPSSHLAEPLCEQWALHPSTFILRP